MKQPNNSLQRIENIMKLIPLIAVICISMLMPAYSAENRMQGLLTLPQVFGNEPCEKFIPETIPVFATSGQSDPIATIRVVNYWQFPKEGGCSGLKVESQFLKNKSANGIFPTKEFGYEKVAAIVLDRSGDWFRIQLSSGTGWIQGFPKKSYMTLEELVESHNSFLTDSWEGLAYNSPMGKIIKFAGKSGSAVKILSKKRINDQLWFQIKIPAEDSCGEIDNNIEEAIGWIPAYSKDDQPTLWFSSRGC